MLNRKPIGAYKEATERWEATNRITIEIFKAFWQKVSPDLTIEAGEEASYNEWQDEYGDKHQGTRKADAARHGVVRSIIPDKYGFIQEATFYENKQHGLSFTWTNHPDTAFTAEIYDHGELKASIWWTDDWSEDYSYGDKELILENNGLSIFKP